MCKILFFIQIIIDIIQDKNGFNIKIDIILGLVGP
jgi:hypothetical protein